MNKENKKKNRWILRYMFLALALFVVGFTLLSGTNASYRATVDGSDTARVAKWSILFNDNEMLSTNLQIDLLEQSVFTDVAQTENGYPKYIVPSMSGYFDFIVENASEVKAELETLDIDLCTYFLELIGNKYQFTDEEWDTWLRTMPINWSLYSIENGVETQLVTSTLDFDSIIPTKPEVQKEFSSPFYSYHPLEPIVFEMGQTVKYRIRWSWPATNSDTDEKNELDSDFGTSKMTIYFNVKLKVSQFVD